MHTALSLSLFLPVEVVKKKLRINLLYAFLPSRLFFFLIVLQGLGIPLGLNRHEEVHPHAATYIEKLLAQFP